MQPDAAVPLRELPRHPGGGGRGGGEGEGDLEGGGGESGRKGGLSDCFRGALCVGDLLPLRGTLAFGRVFDLGDLVAVAEVLDITAGS